MNFSITDAIGSASFKSLGASILLLLTLSACDEIAMTPEPESTYQFPGYELWDKIDIDDGIQTQALTRTSFSFHVKQFRYAVNNTMAIARKANKPLTHCSRLFLAGVTPADTYWFAVVARTHGTTACVPEVDYCLRREDGLLFGQMVVDQDELDTLHSRLLNRDMPGEFVATCNTLNTDDPAATPVGIHAEVGYNGWK